MKRGSPFAVAQLQEHWIVFLIESARRCYHGLKRNLPMPELDSTIARIGLEYIACVGRLLTSWTKPVATRCLPVAGLEKNEAQHYSLTVKPMGNARRCSLVANADEIGAAIFCVVVQFSPVCIGDDVDVDGSNCVASLRVFSRSPTSRSMSESFALAISFDVKRPLASRKRGISFTGSSSKLVFSFVIHSFGIFVCTHITLTFDRTRFRSEFNRSNALFRLALGSQRCLTILYFEIHTAFRIHHSSVHGLKWFVPPLLQRSRLCMSSCSTLYPEDWIDGALFVVP